MDPITLAIITAITAGVVTGTTDVAKQIIVDLYMELKELLKHKYGDESKVIEAVNSLEKNPASDGRKKVVEEEIVSAKADKDSDILQIAQKLVEALKTQPHFVNIVGDGNVVGNGNNVNVVKQIPEEGLDWAGKRDPNRSTGKKTHSKK